MSIKPLISDEDARHVYYILRAMHDASCPNCGHTAESFVDSTWLPPSLTCPECSFKISDAEQRGIETLVPQVLRNRLQAFERNREKLKGLG